jgi:peptidoglycan-associated lipoprotein
MARSDWTSHQVVVATVLIALLPVGCAKRPTQMTAAAPAPVSQAAAAGTTAQPMGGTSGPQTAATSPTAAAARGRPSGAARPAPAEFSPHDALHDIHFDFDKYEIRRSDAAILDANAQWLKTNPQYLLLVEGHADERGTNEYNLALGERRATATTNYLVSRGVRSSRVSIVSYGEDRPACREHTEECWAKNRRAHFLIKAQ